MADLTHYTNGRPIFTAVARPPHQPHHDLHYEMVMVGSGGGRRTLPTAGAGSTTSGLSVGGGGGLEMEIGGGDGNGRWPRQETLTLLEVRSRLNCKFKEANQKGPLWNEVSRIMSEEHGYRRNGKKCREKFENLYKYYKRTKEGKAGRQDGKHYRFFHQLEALYGETTTSTNPNPNPNRTSFLENHRLNVETGTFQPHLHLDNSYQEASQPAPSRLCDSPSLSNNSSAPEYSNPNKAVLPFTENGDLVERRLGKLYWKTKIKDFIDKQMRKIMEKQESWMEKMMKTIEQKEQERVSREEQWKKEETARFEREHKSWANKRAWMESRDLVLMEALHKLTGKESVHTPSFPQCNDHSLACWGENEITRLINLRTSMETRFKQDGNLEEVLWEEIALQMACLGYTRNGSTCKAKWDSILEFLVRTTKPRENTRSSNSYHYRNYQVGGCHEAYERSVTPNDQQNDGCYWFMMGDQENTWDNYGMKLTKGKNH